LVFNIEGRAALQEALARLTNKYIPNHANFFMVKNYRQQEPLQNVDGQGNS